MMIARDNHHNTRLVEFFLEKVYGTTHPSIEDLLRDNVISGTHLSELAVSRASGIELHPIGIGQDLVDKSDIKTCTVRFESGKYRTQIRHLSRKCGKLRVIAYNPFFESWHYFILQPKDYLNRPRITIYFDVHTGMPSGKWRNFVVSSWEEFCKK